MMDWSSKILRNALRILGWTMTAFIVSVVLAAIYYFLFSLVVSTDVEKQLKLENEQLESVLPQTRHTVSLLRDEISYLELRDREIYRNVFKADAPAISRVIEAMYSPDVTSGGRMVVTQNYNRVLDVVARASRVEQGWRDIYDTLNHRDFRMPPSISPIEDINPTRIGASTGMRINPFYKLQIPHDGLDMVAPAGTPVLAAAPGIVSLVRKSSGGKGTMVEITHIDGYVTRYAHLSDVFVSQGQYVKRGAKIATVGDSGRTFTTHLHYEVERDGNVLDPCNFMYCSLSPDEYLNVLIMSSLSGQSQD